MVLSGSPARELITEEGSGGRKARGEREQGERREMDGVVTVTHRKSDDHSTTHDVSDHHHLDHGLTSTLLSSNQSLE